MSKMALADEAGTRTGHFCNDVRTLELVEHRLVLETWLGVPVLIQVQILERDFETSFKRGVLDEKLALDRHELLHKQKQQRENKTKHQAVTVSKEFKPLSTHMAPVPRINGGVVLLASLGVLLRREELQGEAQRYGICQHMRKRRGEDETEHTPQAEGRARGGASPAPQYRQTL